MSRLVLDESQAFEELLSADGKSILELGCGTAEITRAIATTGRNRQITATDVDAIQLAKNFRIDDLPNVTFIEAGAQHIPFDDVFFDIVCLFNSLHHVPVDLMEDALLEVARVLKPGGMVYICEPVFAGDLNEIMRLFHDEEEVRKVAYSTIHKTVECGALSWCDEVFFDSPIVYSSFEDFELKVLGVTHTNFELSSHVYREVRQLFLSYVTNSGARFLTPYRVNLLQKPSTAC